MKHFLLTAAAAAMVLALGSCAKTEVTDVPDSRYIGFDNAYIGNPTKAGLPQDEQFGSKNPISQFFVFGKTAPSDGDVFENVRVYESNGQWVYDDLKQWQNGQTYKFAAYSTNEETQLTETVGFDYDSHTLTITDFVSDNDSQRDLLVATTSEDLNPDNVPVPFNFKHALAMIKFTLQSSLGDKNPITITDFKVNNISTKSTLNVSENNGTQISWGAVYETEEFTNSVVMEAITTTPAVSDEFVIIPQVVSGSITVSFSVSVGGVTSTPMPLTATIENPTWKEGKRYNYVATITGTDINVIEFAEPIVDDWTDDENSPISEDID